MGARQAVYAGSFDPLTTGHLDIIRRAAALFDGLVVAVGSNPRKQYLFPLEQRLAWVAREVEGTARVASFDGLLIDFARSEGCGVIVRGLRGATDFAYEFQMGLTNQQLAPQVETLFLLARLPHLFISASMVKEIAQFGGDPSPYVPPAVADALRGAFGK